MVEPLPNVALPERSRVPGLILSSTNCLSAAYSGFSGFLPPTKKHASWHTVYSGLSLSVNEYASNILSRMFSCLVPSASGIGSGSIALR